MLYLNFDCHYWQKNGAEIVVISYFWIKNGNFQLIFSN